MRDNRNVLGRVTAGARTALGGHRTLVRGAAVALALLAGVGVGVAAAGSGGLDPSFGTSGVTVLERPTSTFPSPTTLAPGGKIVSVTTNLEGKITVSRLLPNGAPDPTFDGDGQAVIESANYFGAYGLAMQSDGKIVVVGYVNKPETSAAMVWRLKANGGSGAPNGALDPTFNGTGFVELNSATYSYGTAVAIEPNGKIVVTANALKPPGPYQVAVWRLLENGTPDTSFDTDGVAGISDAHEDKVNAIALQPDGKIVIAGATANATSVNDAVVWRLKADGGPGGSTKRATRHSTATVRPTWTTAATRSPRPWPSSPTARSWSPAKHPGGHSAPTRWSGGSMRTAAKATRRTTPSTPLSTPTALPN